VGAGSGTMVTGVIGSGWRHPVDQSSPLDLPNVHGACCIITPVNAKVQFPVLNHVHTLSMAPYPVRAPGG